MIKQERITSNSLSVKENIFFCAWKYIILKTVDDFSLKPRDTEIYMFAAIKITQYTGVSVSEQRWGSRYPNKTGVSVSEFFVFLFGYRDPWAKKSC